MANKIFQILRNSTVYNDYTTAAAAFNVPADVTGLIDGQLKSARYVDGNTEKAIIGIWNSTTKKWSMIDIESSLLHAVLNAKQINVTDPSSGETKALDKVIFENETATATSLNDLNEKIKAIENAISTAKEDATNKANAAQAAAISASDVTLVHEDGTLIYTLYQGTDDNKSEIGKINIPKDMVVESGSVITATNDDIKNDSTVVPGKKYIKLVVTNVEKPLYIAVHDLYKDHTAAENATDVQVAISDDNVISATIVNVDASKVTLNDPENTNLKKALTTINNTLDSKQNIIDDLSTIRSKATTAYQKPDGGIPATDLANDVIPSFTIVDDHSGAGSDPDKIYIPSAKSEKETYDGLIEDEEVLAKALNNINDRLNNHASNDLIHLTFGYNKDDFDALIESKVTLNKLIFGKVTTNDYVDLGLPSGTIWAVKNLGATKVEEDGNRYMWGDPTIRNDKADFTTTNCIYDTTIEKVPSCLGYGYKGNVTTYMEKYLDPAYNTYNGAWHTPTKEQFDELIQAYHDAEIAYINGVKVIKLNFIDAKYICFPCTNCWYDNLDNGDAAYREEAYVMCNNIKGVFDSRCIKLSYSNNRVTVSEYHDSIYWGIAVRPVLSL